MQYIQHMPKDVIMIYRMHGKFCFYEVLNAIFRILKIKTQLR